MLRRMFNSRRFVDISRMIAVVAFVGAVLGATTSSWALPGTINLSLLPGAVATASSSRPEGVFDTAPETAIDGNRDGNYGNGSVFYRDANPADLPLFYQVDLGTSAYIERVQLLRRTDANDGVFNNMELTVFKDNGAGQLGDVAWSGNYLQSPDFVVGTWGTTDPGKSAPDGAFGRFVKLTLLDSPYWVDFAEFEVIGSTSPLAFNENDNIAAFKPVTTASPAGYGAQMGSGNDGNIDGSFGNGIYRPVYHSSNFGVGEYWQVDLQSVNQLDHLQLFARGDNYNTSQFKVTVLGADGTTVAGSYIVDNNPLVGPDQGYDHVVNTAGISGQFIRLETTNSEYLTFSELRAFAGPGSFGPGDYNHDGAVDQNDYTTWKQAFGTNNAAADGNGNGTVDAADYTIWRDNATGAGAGGASGATSVPEPSTIVLALGLVTLVWRRQR